MKYVFAITLLAFSQVSMARGGGGHYSSHSSTYGISSFSTGSHIVRGYTRRDGAYVSPHYQTNPNSTRNDNWSTRGNVNPYTGKAGTLPRDGE